MRGDELRCCISWALQNTGRQSVLRDNNIIQGNEEIVLKRAASNACTLSTLQILGCHAREPKTHSSLGHRWSNSALLIRLMAVQRLRNATEHILVGGRTKKPSSLRTEKDSQVYIYTMYIICIRYPVERRTGAIRFI